MLSFAHNTSIRHHDIFAREMDIFLTGFLGEFSGSHTWPQLLLARSREQAIAATYDWMVGSRLEGARRLFNPDFLSRTVEGLRSDFAKSFEEIDNDHPFNIFDCWHFVNIHPQSTYQSPSLDRYRFETRAPMTDRDLVEFALTIPPYSRIEHRIYKKVIAYGFPAIRDVPCTNSGRPINPNFAAEYAAMVMRYAARKTWTPLQRIFGLDQGLGRELGDADAEFRAEPKLADELLRPMLKDGVFPTDIFDHTEIEKIIDEQFRGHGRHWNTLSQLISWGVGSRFFLHDDFSEVPQKLYSDRSPVLV